jgi:predicted double-glycine peptidase
MFLTSFGVSFVGGSLAIEELSIERRNVSFKGLTTAIVHDPSEKETST